MEKYFLTFQEIAEATGGKWIKAPDMNAGINSVKTDSREDCTGALFVALSGENFDAHNFLHKAVASGATALCVEAKKLDKALENINVITVDNTLEAYQKLALFHRKRLTNLKVIAVTGSNGKTSTKEMLRSIFANAFGQDAVWATEGNTNNQVGVPQNIFHLNENHKIAILEMGTNHNGEIEPLSRMAEPDVAVISFVGKAHIENFGTLGAIAREKCAIFSHLKESGFAVIPDENLEQRILEDEAGKFHVLRFGLSSKADIRASYLDGNLYGSSFELKFKKSGETKKISWKLSGIHQAVNAAAAACAATALDVSAEHVASGLQECVLPGMRMRIMEKNGITWINDAYNANPDSMRSALFWLAEFINPSKLILVLGDMLELGNESKEAHFQILRTAVDLFPGVKIVAIGPSMAEASSKSNAEIIAFSNSAEAVDKVRGMAKKGWSVFLKASRGTKLEIIEPE